MYNQNLFSKKKYSYVKPILIALFAAGILGFGFWFSQVNSDMDGMAEGISEKSQSEVVKKVDEKSITDDLAVNSMKPVPNSSNGGTMSGPAVTESDAADGTDEVMEDDEMIDKASKPYYLVKETDGLIKLYYYSASGEEKLIRVTDIPYEMLAESDQGMFHTGMIKYTIEELNDLLQDFES